MRIFELSEIRRTLVYRDIVVLMRDALIAQFRGECDTPMPMHLDMDRGGEVHMKSCYRRGGRFFALKVASTFPANVESGLPTGNGMMLLASAETGEPVALLADASHLTDVRTAAVTAMVARELGRQDRRLGILGTGIQARLQARMHARMHAEVLDLDEIWIWGRDPQRALACRQALHTLAPKARVEIAASPAEVAQRVRLIVTATSSRQALLRAWTCRRAPTFPPWAPIPQASGNWIPRFYSAPRCCWPTPAASARSWANCSMPPRSGSVSARLASTASADRFSP